MNKEKILEDGKLKHLVKAMDSATVSEGTEFIPEGYSKKKKLPIICRVKLSEMKTLKKATFILRKYGWKGKFAVRGVIVDHWDLIINKNEKYLDEFSGMLNNPIEKSNSAYCLRRDCSIKALVNGSDREWMTFYGEILPDNPTLGNHSKQFSAFIEIVDSGPVDIALDTSKQVSLVFHGKKLKDYWTIKRESLGGDLWKFSKSLKTETQAKNRRDQCMECSKPPKYECIWAEGHGRCWMCDKCFREWSTKGDGKGEIISVKEVQNGEAAKKFSENKNPNIRDKINYLKIN